MPEVYGTFLDGVLVLPLVLKECARPHETRPMFLTSFGFFESSDSSGNLLGFPSIDPRFVPSGCSRKKWNRLLTPRPLCR